MKKISTNTLRRLPRYYRLLDEMVKSGQDKTSSGKLAKIMGLNASQIRNDLNCFGGFGQQGYGYNTLMLRDEIGRLLGHDRHFGCIVIGAGNLGRALISHINFKDLGYRLVGVFDSNEAFAGQMVSGMPIRHISGLDDFCRLEKPTVAVICVPKEATRDIGEQLYRLGVKALWNFSPYDLSVELPDVIVENVHLEDSLMALGYKIQEKLYPDELFISFDK